MSTSPTALLFPGQGSQTADMRATVERRRPDLLEAAVAVVGEDPFARADESTRFAQPAIFCASVAALGRLEELRPVALAGHSLGEFAALVASGSLGEEDGLRLVDLRGRLMEDAGARRPGTGMLAVVGRGGGAIAAQLAEQLGLTVANDNSPDQVVLSGDGDALDEAAVAAGELGLRALRLPVSAAFHSPVMASAVPDLAAALADVTFRAPRVPVLSGVTAEPFDDVRRRLAEGLTEGVRWREVLLALRARGVERFVEAGPGKVLTGLVRRTLPGVEALPAERLEEAVRV